MARKQVSEYEEQAHRDAQEQAEGLEQQVTALLLEAGVAAAEAAALAAVLVALVASLPSFRIGWLGREASAFFTGEGSGLDEAYAAYMRRELEFERVFVRRVVERILRDLKKAIRERKPLADTVRRIADRERRYNGLRRDAVRRRWEMLRHEERVRAESPDGAYWRLDESKATHTIDCLAMANRAWSWRVLSIIRPSNRHTGCGCSLYPLSWAQAHSWPNARIIGDTIPAAAYHEE